ncbi:hypothetical protein FOQG_03654 [Fusarium oxysporum f. sp. raphani 54005]|uniref:Uncharacterized protein n=2 Tax=Fusarium oxysporum TaxID=5507 RepID=X0CK96_FUSOX|nr:hypothetical protein FOVG_10709 [Fusarium oxysporum f. sp. pisi HDV247]EXK94858.1 hypothetical protein FOQG_03654 [Fusarium oxysporum f. sp. raphani 54005]EXA38982.1 hypothetical protein FOVG_10709 [Fusarium oxysporum f. sp. pisi HDV247]EXA38983.1 hypothetical protein FOVG_10709 [Fusarium oxysporum f. sp. pisi HDV247]EXK94859.1 hypothetical protein FOQG_03654 [Fusarium oxysporum f. sp. raphani 54005]
MKWLTGLTHGPVDLRPSQQTRYPIPTEPNLAQPHPKQESCTHPHHYRTKSASSGLGIILAGCSRTGSDELFLLFVLFILIILRRETRASRCILSLCLSLLVYYCKHGLVCL